jgi:hypothetical protein
MACLEEKPYFLRAKLPRNWLAIEAIHKHSRTSTAGDRDRDNGPQLAGRLDKPPLLVPPCAGETRERLSCASPSHPHCNYCHTKTKQNQQRVKNCRLRRCSFRRRRFWPTRKFDRNLDLRTCPRLETPLRIRFKSSAIKLFVSGALQHSRSGNFAGLLIDRHQHHAFPCEPLFRPFGPVHRFGRVDRLWRLLCHCRSSDLGVHGRNRNKREHRNQSEPLYLFRSGNSVAFANQPRRCRAHLRIRHSIHASVEQVVNKSRRESESEQRRQPCGCS